ncbi:type II toxin-antitoxin system VapC family toxin [Methylobacterium persicinum]|uniref:Ribonuclease VapC n=1 Tax=Methylobacterium persicinum TaxID=374426 RepID=A0ABU0HRX1_9HYPH|nr:type II toxin-antitoxin system VapC family toxin [Methylobacterium persicinum]MDQ0445065.1 ribonuclease VapC [Methylobacterium persicinum]GJE40689.1 Ribonuclease VapC30 [Methylobacterium persicinum]
MFVDASALTAILTDEDDARELVGRLKRASRRMTSPLAVWETTVAVARRLGLSLGEAREAVGDYLALAGIVVMPIPPEVGDTALDAFDRFGKSRHPAALNFGDCFAYACARHYRARLLFKGDDFPHTDIDLHPA